ncbi:MAG: hypothetical protein IPN76_17470 [Saprospiraceae bacterium]|nr:hypothetical protein [Saprospiraceae bacterium]
MVTASYPNQEFLIASTLRTLRKVSGDRSIVDGVGNAFLFPVWLLTAFFFLIANFWMRKKFRALMESPFDADKYRKIRKIYSVIPPDYASTFSQTEKMKKSIRFILYLLLALMRFGRTFEEFQAFAKPFSKTLMFQDKVVHCSSTFLKMNFGIITFHPIITSSDVSQSLRVSVCKCWNTVARWTCSQGTQV